MHFDNARHAKQKYMAVQPRRVHTITDRFSMANAYLINEEQMIVVDPSTELHVKQIQSYLWTFLHRPLSHIDLIVLTHLHPNHIAGVEALLRICDVPVAALAVLHAEKGEKNSSSVRLTEQTRPGTHQHFNPSPLAHERQTKLINLWLNDVEGLPGHPNWRIIASPGHTPESLCLYNPFSRELLCGDAIITIQWGTPLLRGGPNHRQLEETLRILRSLRIHYLYPGQGRPMLGQQPLSDVDIEW